MRLSSSQALARLQRLCSRSEKCVSDIRKKLADWEVPAAEAPEIIASLQAGGFVDEQRYAKAFARDKSRLARWGLLKISNALKNKQINDAVIKTALEEIDPSTAHDNLVHLLRQKKQSLKPAPPEAQKVKLLRFALSRGYSYEEARGVVDGLFKMIPDK